MNPIHSDARAFAAEFVPAEPPARGERVVVGLSGGVDSAVVAWSLAEAGCEVVAVTTRNFCHDDARFHRTDAPRSCCSQEAIDASAALSGELGLQHMVLDATADFGRDVIDDFVAEYRAGHTPSPCVRCNTRVRFPRLLDFATRIGARRVATGHYARILRHVSGSRHVGRGRDAAKDQSYFLFRLPPERLERTLLPLGDRTKEEVRELARRHGLPVAETPDSQELCFVPDGDRRPLLREGARPGEVVDTEGRVLGEHPGVEYFTPGQRKGLALGGGPPRYVLGLDAARNRVIVGAESELQRRSILADGVVMRDPRPHLGAVVARTRYRHPGLEVDDWPSVAARIEESVAPDATVEFRFVQADRAPAPGQAVVFDRAGVILGGGRIVSEPWRRVPHPPEEEEGDSHA